MAGIYNGRPGGGGGGGYQGRRPPQQPEPEHRINNRIRAPKVRLVGDNIENPGVYTIQEAMRMADRLSLDLVEISPNADPPVCRILDYQKFLYQQKKRQKELKAKQVKTVIKEIRFGPQTDDHDYDFKLRHATKFLEEGSKVKAYVFFRGRSIVFKEQGEILLLRFANDLEEVGKVESMPSLEGKRMTMFLAPKSRKGKASNTADTNKDADAKKEADAKKPTEASKATEATAQPEQPIPASVDEATEQTAAPEALESATND